jgi:hypothetical protein
LKHAVTVALAEGVLPADAALRTIALGIQSCIHAANARATVTVTAEHQLKLESKMTLALEHHHQLRLQVESLPPA